MSARALSIEEAYLAALLMDESGIDLAELSWIDEEKPDACYRLWPFQHVLYRNKSTYQIDFMARSLGKTQGIIMRACAFIFNFPGQEMLIGAPELNHLRPVVDKIEQQILRNRLTREMLPARRGNGINHQPQFQAQFINNARIVSRLPNRDGRGFKGQHPLKIELDECFPTGTLVTTRRGQVPIEDVVVGDQVLTHKNRWRAVTDTMTRQREVVTVKGQGHPGITCSVNHKFYAMRERAVYLPADEPNQLVHQRKSFDEPKFIPAVELESCHWSSPTTFPKVKGTNIPQLRVGRGRRRGDYVPILNVDDPATYWMVGHWLAEGSVGTSGYPIGHEELDRITVSIHEDETPEVFRRLEKCGLHPSGPYPVKDTKGVNLVMYGKKYVELANWLVKHFGRGAHEKEIAPWALGLPRPCREELLEGLIYGDGCWGKNSAGSLEMKLTTVSKGLAVTSRMLGLSLGYSVSLYWHDASGREVYIRGRRVNCKGWYQVVFRENGQGHLFQNKRYTKVKRVERLNRVETLYDLTVEDDHSFIAEGIVVSNSQDVPDNGWIELIETMKAASPGASWRCHGVSRGVRDRYYRYTMQQDPDIPFYVHRYMAMHRPSWGPEERKAKIAIYGGTEDNVDYRRNVYGEHGDATATLFVLHRLMAAVRVNESAWATEYNDNVYAQLKVNDELLASSGAPIETFLQFPGNHLDENYFNYWVGMDVGYTRDPSEILIFGETEPKKGAPSLMRLLSRVHLMRVSAADQASAIRHIFEFYGDRLRRFSMDKTGNGLPLWQELDPEAVGTHVSQRRTPEHISQRVQGYGFSQKVAVEFDDRDLNDKERPEDALIQKNVVSFAADELRKYVDTGRIELPYDAELLSEWQGQEVQYVRDEGAAAGIKTRMVGGSLHTLDAAFMCFAGKELMHIEEVLATKPTKAPVLARFGF